MKVVLYGASGMIGSRILAELLARGHRVTAVARDANKIAARPNVEAVTGDVLDPASVAQTARGAEAAISAYAPPQDHPALVVRTTEALIAGLPRAAVQRLLMVGGAGSLEVAPGLLLVDAPNFPEIYKGIALAHRDALEVLRTSPLQWTSLSPAAVIEPGQRTGKFRLATDQLVSDSAGQSRISAEDFAIALVDELEQGRHVRQRFTLGYE